MPYPRRQPHKLVPINTSIDASLADLFYHKLEMLKDNGAPLTTRRAVAEALELWLAHQDVTRLQHLRVEEIPQHAIAE